VALSIRLGTETLRRGDALAVSGVGFDPRGQFLITLDQGGTQYQLLAPTPGPANGSFSVRVFIPGQATPGPATITACATTSSGRTEGCAQQRVSVAS
jgi:hypothetical protein